MHQDILSGMDRYKKKDPAGSSSSSNTFCLLKSLSFDIKRVNRLVMGHRCLRASSAQSSTLDNRILPLSLIDNRWAWIAFREYMVKKMETYRAIRRSGTHREESCQSLGAGCLPSPDDVVFKRVSARRHTSPLTQ